jgi:flotillin
VAAPLAQCNKVVMVSHGSGDVGAGKLTGEVLDIIAKVHMTVAQMTGTTLTNVSGPKNHRSNIPTAT